MAVSRKSALLVVLLTVFLVASSDYREATASPGPQSPTSSQVEASPAPSLILRRLEPHRMSGEIGSSSPSSSPANEWKTIE